MDNEKIKEMLLDIAPTNLDFTVTQSGKESKRVNGLYKPDTHEIILHNKNFKTEYELVYTAVHEYTHHLIAEEQIALNGSAYMPNAKVHTDAFWAKFHSLLKIAEEKKYYSIDLESSPELKALTEDIQKNYLEANGKLMQEFGKLLAKAHELCEQANIRYEDYLDRVLCLPRNSARDITRVGRVNDVNPAIGFDNMKMISAIKKSDERAHAQEQILSGESPVTVRSLMKQKAQQTDDPRSKLEKEKNRLAKTIAQLQQRLDFVEETLASM
ncbi:hypothetical protein [Treponema sp.]|uniref:hypothetical protein n=1 Tax=Treponema sp. TaxID=166 RepID=UPI00298DB110|nr:hypothetical protein [Treponema sp.]MCR5612705.1 hypothetical protein [Treponema sp.]